MNDLGLVSVHVGPNNPNCNIGGPVAVLMENEDYFLGAFVVGEDQLGVKLFPKKFKGTTGWLRNYPAATRLLNLLAQSTLDGVDMFAIALKAELQEQKLDRRTTIVESEPTEKTLTRMTTSGPASPVVPMPPTPHPLLQEVRERLKKTYGKLQQFQG
jgi:hypothetical protein